jgi:trimeric autotransporter adhesin
MKSKYDVNYFNTSDATKFTIQPVSAWQGLRNYGDKADQYLICGTANKSNGLLYVGSISGGGASYPVTYPGSTATSVYGPDNLPDDNLRLVGSYKLSGDGDTIYNHGFVWDGTLADLPSGGTFRTLDYPAAKYQFTHSTMGNLAVGNADGPMQVGGKTLPIGPGIAYIYDIPSATFVANIVYPGSKSNTAYGIWHNGGTSYTICGGYSPVAANNLANQKLPLTQGRGYLVDYDSATRQFSNWTSFDYPNGPEGVNFITHFEGISSTEPGIYTLSADSVQTDSANLVQGSWVRVSRTKEGGFDQGEWVDLNYPGSTHSVTSSNSVYGNQVVGVVIGADPFSYQATVVIAD